MVAYPSTITFHTATLHWVVLSSTSQIHINITYQVLLTEDGNSFNNSTSVNSSSHSEYSFLVVIMKTSGDGNHAHYRTELSGLKHGTSYGAAVMVLTITGIRGDAVETHFRTLEYSKLCMSENFKELSHNITYFLYTWSKLENVVAKNQLTSLSPWLQDFPTWLLLRLAARLVTCCCCLITIASILTPTESCTPLSPTCATVGHLKSNRQTLQVNQLGIEFVVFFIVNLIIALPQVC